MGFGPKLMPTGRGNRKGGMSARIALGGGKRSSSFRLVLAFSKAMGPKIPLRKVDVQFGVGEDDGMVLLTFCITGSFQMVKNGAFGAHRLTLPIPPGVPSTCALPTRDCTFESRGENQIAVNLPVSLWKADLQKFSARVQP